MTSVERMYALYNSVKYVIENSIEGDFVECGVWRGGSSMLIAKVLLLNGISNRKIYLYDTFEGMASPTNDDISIDNEDAQKLMYDNEDNKEESVWCFADINDVKINMQKVKYPFSNIYFVKGKVEEAIPTTMPVGKVALLRLDTDFYESTKHELNFLYPILSNKGVLIIDDYGHWKGCRKAVDEYFVGNNIKILLNRIDYTGRLGIKD